MYQNLLVQTTEKVTTITINRPSQLNALNKETISELNSALDSADKDSEVGAVIIIGSGEKAFVAGADIKEFAESCFRVTFPLFTKIDVKGPQQAPLYAYLAKHIEKKPFKFIPWNFTKILVDANGRVIRRYLPITSFKTIRKAIEELLPA